MGENVESSSAVARSGDELRSRLARWRIADLRELASKFSVELRGRRTKRAILRAIASSPEADEILTVVHAPDPTSVPPPPPPTLDDPEVDPAIVAAKNTDVDFGQSEDLLDQARMRYEEGNLDRSIVLAEQAAVTARSTMEAFARAVGAYAILCSQRLIEDCSRAGRDVHHESRLLRRAKRSFLDGSLLQDAKALAALRQATRDLHAREVDTAREEVRRVQGYISTVANLGASVTAAEEVLSRGRDALRRNDPLACTESALMAERLADAAGGKRIAEIAESLPAAGAVVEEARSVGADVDEGDRLLEKARVAIAEGQYVLATELANRAERVAVQGQQQQIEKAMELRRRQVEKARSILKIVQPLLLEAASFGLDVSEARTLLRRAREALAKEDHANVTTSVQDAEATIRRLQPRVNEERRRHGILKPASGVCGTCGGRRLEFRDDGWGVCFDCRRSFRWRSALGPWKRLRAAVRR